MASVTLATSLASQVGPLHNCLQINSRATQKDRARTRTEQIRHYQCWRCRSPIYSSKGLETFPYRPSHAQQARPKSNIVVGSRIALPVICPGPWLFRCLMLEVQGPTFWGYPQRLVMLVGTRGRRPFWASNCLPSLSHIQEEQRSEPSGIFLLRQVVLLKILFLSRNYHSDRVQPRLQSREDVLLFLSEHLSAPSGPCYKA